MLAISCNSNVLISQFLSTQRHLIIMQDYTCSCCISFGSIWWHRDASSSIVGNIWGSCADAKVAGARLFPPRGTAVFTAHFFLELWHPAGNARHLPWFLTPVITRKSQKTPTDILHPTQPILFRWVTGCTACPESPRRPWYPWFGPTDFVVSDAAEVLQNRQLRGSLPV